MPCTTFACLALLVFISGFPVAAHAMSNCDQPPDPRYALETLERGMEPGITIEGATIVATPGTRIFHRGDSDGLHLVIKCGAALVSHSTTKDERLFMDMNDYERLDSTGSSLLVVADPNKRTTHYRGVSGKIKREWLRADKWTFQEQFRVTDGYTMGDDGDSQKEPDLDDKSKSDDFLLEIGDSTASLVCDDEAFELVSFLVVVDEDKSLRKASCGENIPFGFTDEHSTVVDVWAVSGARTIAKHLTAKLDRPTLRLPLPSTIREAQWSSRPVVLHDSRGDASDFMGWTSCTVDRKRTTKTDEYYRCIDPTASAALTWHIHRSLPRIDIVATDGQLDQEKWTLRLNEQGEARLKIRPDWGSDDMPDEGKFVLDLKLRSSEHIAYRSTTSEQGEHDVDVMSKNGGKGEWLVISAPALDFSRKILVVGGREQSVVGGSSEHAPHRGSMSLELRPAEAFVRGWGRNPLSASSPTGLTPGIRNGGVGFGGVESLHLLAGEGRRLAIGLAFGQSLARVRYHLGDEIEYHVWQFYVDGRLDVRYMWNVQSGPWALGPGVSAGLGAAGVNGINMLDRTVACECDVDMMPVSTSASLYAQWHRLLLSAGMSYRQVGWHETTMHLLFAHVGVGLRTSWGPHAH